MRINWIRPMMAGCGLLAVLWLAGSTNRVLNAAEGDDAATRTVAAEIAFLQKGLEKTPEKRAVPTLKAAAMNIALLSTGANKEAALKVSLAIAAKDYAGAKTAASKLAAGAAGKPGDAEKLAASGKYDISEVMSAFRGEKVGGQNIEKDIRTNAKGVKDILAAELIASRTALLGVYTMALPTDKATANNANKKQWSGFTSDMNKIAGEILAETAKGDKADKAALAKKFAALDGSCTACHNVFRD